MNTQGPSSWTTAEKAEQVDRRYISIREIIDASLRYIELGMLLILPIAVAFFSLKYALALIAFGLASYGVGMLVCEFDVWYNNRGVPILTYKEKESSVSTDLEIILDRLSHFEDKYFITIKTMYRYLDRNEIPYKNNLDWVEIVSLLNQLSLYIGKHFDEDNTKGTEQQ